MHREGQVNKEQVRPTRAEPTVTEWERHVKQEETHKERTFKIKQEIIRISTQCACVYVFVSPEFTSQTV